MSKLDGGVGKVPYTATQKYTFKPIKVKPAPDKSIVFTEAEATAIKPAPDERIVFTEPTLVKGAVDLAQQIAGKEKSVAVNSEKEGK